MDHTTLYGNKLITVNIKDKNIKNIYVGNGASYLIKPPESTTRQSAFAIFYLSVINSIFINLTILIFSSHNSFKECVTAESESCSCSGKKTISTWLAQNLENCCFFTSQIPFSI
jgi:hypothetical protein